MRLSAVILKVLGSGKQASLIKILDCGFNAGIKLRSMRREYSSDQLWNIHLKK